VIAVIVAIAVIVVALLAGAVVGDMSLDEVLSKREDMNNTLRLRLDDVTERWGVKVTNVEVREINPPPGVLEAMTRQMSAERTRRAVVTEAEGTKQAAITVARARSSRPFWLLRATGRRPSCRPKDSRWRCSRSTSQPRDSTPTP
jgi:regulator of protease activity HflC (stomatin/prohibitin superfamily)